MNEQLKEQHDSLGALFGADLTSVETTRPLLSRGAVRFVVADCKIEQASDKVNKNLVIVVKSLHDHPDTKGGVAKAGYKLTHRISLKPKNKDGDDRLQSIQADLKRFRVACTGQKSGTFGDPASYIGCEPTANVSIESDETGQYGDQNRLSWVESKGNITPSTM